MSMPMIRGYNTRRVGRLNSPPIGTLFVIEAARQLAR